MTLTVRASPFVIPLAGTGCSILDVGGKAAGLDRLAFHGFPIPTSVAVTSTAYREFVAGSGLAGYLDTLAAAPLGTPDRLEAEAAEVGRMWLEPPLSVELFESITSAVVPLLEGGPVAVRSSATAEDMGIASFAGQYRSFMDVTTIDGVVEAIRRCWASMWLPAARAYRRRHGITEEAPAMAVVVQSMVAADWSGVGFTRDPGGRQDVLRVEVVPGLGEALVSGRITPADFTISRSTLEIRGGEATDPPVFLEDLGRMLLQVEDRFDEPQDVEWACADGEIVLLQARPITVPGPMAALDDGFDEPTASADTFTPHGVAEMLPGVVPPLLWTINAPMIEDAFRVVVATLGRVPIPPGRRFVARFRGRSVLDLSALADVARGLPGGSPAEVERQFLGRTVTGAGAEDDPPRRAGVRAVLRARSAQRRLADEVELATAAVTGIIALGTDLEGLPARLLLAYREELRDLAWRITAAEVSASSAGAAAYRGLELVLQRWLDAQEAAEWAQRLTAGSLSTDLAGVDLAQSLETLYASALARHGGIRAALVGTPISRARERLLQLGQEGHRFVAEVDGLLRNRGCMAVYAGESWAEKPELVWEQLALRAGNRRATVAPVGGSRALDQLMRHLSRRRGWFLMRVLTGQILDLRRRWILRQAGEASRFLALRERAKGALLALGGEERRIIVEGARRLVASRQLADGAQVELLSDTEFAAMMFGAAPPPSGELYRRALVRRRCLEAGALPELFVGSPDVEPHHEIEASATLRGWAASPGSVVGPARVIGGLDDGRALQRGDVLVAHSTDPSWTPLLMIAGGLVLEQGGPLSHGAIVAREFGIPAVLAVGGAVRVLVDGESVEVDGYAGVVRRLDVPCGEGTA